MNRLMRHPLVLLFTFIVFVSSVYMILTYFSPKKSFRLPTIGGSRSGVIDIIVPDTIFVNKPFKATVRLNTQGNYVNATGIYLRFEPSKLHILSMDTTGSFCQFYPEKRFDNNIGTVSLACGSPHPGVRGEDSILLLEFMPTVVGSSAIRTDPQSKLLMSDGKGTNILTEYPVVTINAAASF